MKRVTALFFILLIVGLRPSVAQTPLRGTITDENLFREFPFTVTQAGSTVVLEANAINDSALDSFLYLVDEDNLILASNDNATPDTPNARIEYAQMPRGNYIAVASRAGLERGRSSGVFELTIGITPPLETTDRIEASQLTNYALTTAGYPAYDPKPKANWTVLAYYGADTDLEPDLLNDIDEFERGGGSNESVRIVVLVDRYPGGEYANQDEDWETARLFEVKPDVSEDAGIIFPPTIDTPAIADLGERNMGDPLTLAQFLVWGVRNYPAENYVISLASHGAAWEGLIVDDSTNADILSIPELNMALETARQAAQVETFDLLINDACSMSSIEYYASMQNYFDFVIGSPEVVINPAFDMALLVELLNDNTSTELFSLGQALVDKYIERDIFLNVTQAQNADYFTGAVTDLTQFAGVHRATEAFARTINRNPQQYIRLLGEARANTYVYTEFAGLNSWIDLGNFMQRIIAQSTDLEVTVAAQTVLDALDIVRLYAEAGDIASQSASYYNIYFPQKSDAFDPRYFDETTLPEWGRMLRWYFTYAEPQLWTGSDSTLAFHAPQAPQVSITNLYPDRASFTSPVIVELEIVGKNFQRIWSIYDQPQADGSILRLRQRPQLQTVFDREQRQFRVENYREPGVIVTNSLEYINLLQVSDGENTFYEFLRESPDGERIAYLDGQYRPDPDSAWRDVTVVFTQRTSALTSRLLQMTSTSVISRNRQSSALGVIQMEPGAEFQTYRYLVRSDGSVVQRPGNTYQWSENGLRVNEVPAPTGEYLLTVQAEAFGNLSGAASTAVQVNNSSVDAEVVTDIAHITRYGFTMPIPATWGSQLQPYIQNNISILAADNRRRPTIDPSQRYEVYWVPGVADLEYLARYQLSAWDKTWDAVQAESTLIDGQEALAYSITVDEDTDAQAFAVYQTSIDMGLVFVAITRNDTTAQLATLMREGIRLVDVPTIQAASQAAWTFRALSDDDFEETRFPMPIAWGQGFLADNWLKFTPTGLNEGTSFASFRREPETDAATLLASLQRRYVSNRYETRAYTYYGENQVWQALQYESDNFVGRFYVTIQNGQAYVARFEARREDAIQLFPAVFEPIVDGFKIEILYQTFESQSLGFRFQYPATIQEWDSLIFFDADKRLVVKNWNGDARIDVYYFPDSEADLERLADSLVEKLTTPQTQVTIRNIIPRLEVDEREILQFDVVIDSENPVLAWQGRFFVTYDPQREMGYAFGAKDNRVYQRFVESIQFLAGDYTPFSSYQRRDLGFAVEIPLLWSPVIEQRVEGSLRINRLISRNQNHVMEILVQRTEATDLATLVDAIAAQAWIPGTQDFVLTNTPQPITVDGQPAAMFKITYDLGIGRVWQGQYIVYYDDERRLGVVIGVRSSDTDNLTASFNRLLASITRTTLAGD